MLPSLVNRFLLPGTNASSYNAKVLGKNLLMIPKNLSPSQSDFIPCLYYPTFSGYLILYFHGNSEDIGIISDLLLEIQKTLPHDFLAVEYPNYGLYKGKSSPAQIMEDSETVYNYVKSKFPDKKIIVFGRSIGTGPAIYLASKVNPEALILVSAFKSVKDILKDKWLGWLSDPVFTNSELIGKVNCPILFLHGKLDSLIKCEHSKEMFESVIVKNKNSKLEIRPYMDHNQFHIEKDLTEPINEFLKRIIFPEEQKPMVDLLGMEKPKI